MDNFMISGIQQIGVGTEDFRKSWDWYIDMFGIDVKILEDDTVAERMLPYTGGKPQQRHACIAVSLQGGGGFEIWQYSKRKPVACPFTISVGDLGIFAAKLNCCDVAAFHRELSAKWEHCTSPEDRTDGVVLPNRRPVRPGSRGIGILPCPHRCSCEVHGSKWRSRNR